ncbi:MAG: acetyl-CoA carboxylase carboxyltransferase subunit alpha [Planctomycetota bacterium]|jgi:acetyl-CoA carboxylase carboxyl transferase subunit alpha
MSNGSQVAKADLAAASENEYLEFEKPLLRIRHDVKEMEREQNEGRCDLTKDIKQQRHRYQTTMKRLYSSLTPWETVLVARHPKRPQSTDYLSMIFRDYCELHGDRTYSDDRAIMTGFARIGGHKVMFVGHNKGKDLKERVECNFGCAHPEGYRKSLLKMRLAEKYKLPVVCLIDTQGAYPGVGSEERGISTAIAVNLMEMSRLRVPIVCAVIGEGGSGGALGIGVGDRVAMFQHSFYSVISPEGCAAILWKTANQRKHAAEALKITAQELIKLNVIDHVIPEPVGGAHRDPDGAASHLERFICSSLDSLKSITVDSLVRKRQDRIRNLGNFFESKEETEDSSHLVRARRTRPRSTRLRTQLSAVSGTANPQPAAKIPVG